MYWLVGLGLGIGGYIYYNAYVDPWVALPGPMGLTTYKRQSQVTPADIEFKNKVISGEIKT